MAVLDAPAPPAPAAPVARSRPLAPAAARVTAPADRPRRARDPFVDVVRALGTLGVVLLHWLMAEATWDGDTLLVGNALGHGAGWLVTWLQPLALLFFAAGASAGYQRGATVAGGRGWGGTMLARLRATARPVGAFVGAWALAVAALLALGVPDDAVWRMARMAPQLLWFLGVWVVLMALAPVLRAAWQRWRWGALAVAVALPLALDALRFGLPGELTGTLAWANVLLAWAAPFLAGIAYATERSAPRRPVTDRADEPLAGRTARWLLAAGAVAAVAATAVLVAVGPYPLSLVGMPGDEISNLGPPTAPVVAHAVAQVCLVLLFRAALVRRAANGAGKRAVDALARRSMTVYLWHLTAMFAVVGVALLGLGQELPAAWGADWWASRPVWFAAYLLVLLGLVRVFGRFEGRRRSRLAVA
ncbi:acyltransferase family protein [Isoptericola sp. F-RaC21]|uniref:acyltransferase family protein n=1 Tax=Isoptericola sp. F-RaC21 TaxID=3141452 RepID=UPI00315BB850